VTFAFIEQHASTWPVRLMCRVLEVSPSGYYGWRSRPESARSTSNRQLLDDVRRIHAGHHRRYGSRRVHAELRVEGRSASRGRVERLMRRHDSRHDLPIAPNLLKQQFSAALPNRVWLADITSLPTGEGWLYLACSISRPAKSSAGPCAITCGSS
jgi:putative transposase